MKSPLERTRIPLLLAGLVFSWLWIRNAGAGETLFQLTNYFYQNDRGLSVNSAVGHWEAQPNGHFKYFAQGLYDYIYIKGSSSGGTPDDHHHHDGHDHGGAATPVDGVTGASARVSADGNSREGRMAGTVGFSHTLFHPDFWLGPQAGFSIEPDYRSFSGGLTGQASLFQKNTLLKTFALYGVDISEPASPPPGQAGLWPAGHQRLTGGFSLSQVLLKTTVAESGADVSYQSGTLESPYRNATVITTLFPERVPGDRTRVHAYLHLSQYLGFESAAHARLGHVWDSWGVLATYPEIKWAVGIGRSWLFHTSYRYYRQYRAADFYAQTFSERKTLMSGDVRLGRLTDHTVVSGLQWEPFGKKSAFLPSLHFEYQGSLTEYASRVWGHYAGVTAVWKNLP